MAMAALALLTAALIRAVGVARSRASARLARMDDESVVSQLNVVAVGVCVLGRRKIRDYQLQERVVGDVPGRHDE